jgi:hypothetical protein
MTTSIDGPECKHGHCYFDPTPCAECKDEQRLSREEKDAMQDAVVRRMTDAQPQSQREKLLDRLFGNPNVKVVNFKIDRGERPASAEEICRQINGALDQVESGEIVPTDDFPEDDEATIDVREIP